MNGNMGSGRTTPPSSTASARYGADGIEELAGLYAYLRSTGLLKQDVVALIADYMHVEARKRHCSCRYGIGHWDPAYEAEHLLAAWTREFVGGGEQDDRLVVLSLFIVIGFADAASLKDGGFLTDHPSIDLVHDLSLAMPTPTPPEDPGEMPSKDYQCWQLSEIVPGVRFLSSRLARRIRTWAGSGLKRLHDISRWAALGLRGPCDELRVIDGGVAGASAEAGSSSRATGDRIPLAAGVQDHVANAANDGSHPAREMREAA